MIRINLLPKKPHISIAKYDLYFYFLIVAVNVFVLGGVYLTNTRNIAQYSESIEKMKKEIKSLEGIQREYVNMDKEKKEIDRRIRLIENIKEGRALAARSLYDLSSIVKENVWLKTFKKTEDKFELEGRSLENESISGFIENLSRIPYMKNVELKSVEDISEEGVVVKKFMINGNMSL